MENIDQNSWSNLRIGITGASGRLGKALAKELKSKGAFVIGLTSKSIRNQKNSPDHPDEWVTWQCGEEELLDKTLNRLNILILNHGINSQGSQSNFDINKSLEVNALSTWRIFERFENLSKKKTNNFQTREVWVNTSEAEILPAVSPTYEISKRLIGQLISLKMKELNIQNNSSLIVKKIVLGPFKSELNPIGIMNADLVAKKLLNLANSKRNLIIISPNPLTYLLMPLIEFFRFIYFKSTESLNKI